MIKAAAVLLLASLSVSCGGSRSVHAQNNGPLDYAAWGQGWHSIYTDANSCKPPVVHGGLRTDSVSKRYVAVVQASVPPYYCSGHPTAPFGVRDVRPSWWNSGQVLSFCIDQIYLQDKVPVTWRPSYLVMDWITVRSADGSVNIGPVCYGPGEFPRMDYLNNWTEVQNVRVTFAGEVR